MNNKNVAHQSSDEPLQRACYIEYSDLLTREQEVELGRRALSGDIEARNALVNANYKLVAKIAYCYINSGVPFEELFQEGCLGLINAASRFDPDRNCRFSTYASFWIKNYITKASIRSGFSTKIPRRLAPYINKVLSFAHLFELTNHREPTVEEIAQNVDVAPEIVKDVLTFTSPLSEYNDNFGSHNECQDNPFSSTTEENVVSNIMSEELIKIIDSVLCEEEKYIIYNRFSSGTRITKKELAAKLNTDVSCIVNIEKKAYRKIRRYFLEKKLDYHSFFPQ